MQTRGGRRRHITATAVRYGTFAEIGAGQEVARWFFRVGGAAGTIAKSISACALASGCFFACVGVDTRGGHDGNADLRV